MRIHAHEHAFVVTDKYVKDRSAKHEELICDQCTQPFVPGHVLHTKFNGTRNKRRHIVCAVKLGLVEKDDYELMVLGNFQMNRLDGVMAPEPITTPTLP